MTDIVERLRRAERWATEAELAATPGICRDAADEIERLRAALETATRNTIRLLGTTSS